MTYCGSTSSVSRITMDGCLARSSSSQANHSARSLCETSGFSSRRQLLASPWRVGGTHVLADLRRVDLHVDDLGLGREVLQPPGHPVVEAHANADNQVRFADSDVVPVHAVHSRHA